MCFKMKFILQTRLKWSECNLQGYATGARHDLFVFYNIENPYAIIITLVIIIV